MERVSGIRREKHLHLLEVLFLGCFVIGIIAANLYGRSRLQQYGILNDYFIQQLKYITIENMIILFMYYQQEHRLSLH